VIPHAEILALRAEWGLRDDVIEKDYVLGWLLAGIAEHPSLQRVWIFKGGTCLRKCYYETYRFSEDLDFTVTDGGPETVDELLPVLRDLADWLRDRVGIEIEVGAASVRRGVNRRGNPTTTVRLAYRGPRNPPNLPKIKIDLTSDEVVAADSVLRPVAHPYSDAGALGSEVRSYSLQELLAEKLRALIERCRPRDLYDVIHVFRHSELIDDPRAVAAALKIKCSHAGVPVPDAAAVRASPFRAELDQEWENMLAHQLPHLPDVDGYWAALDEMFDWIRGAPRPALTRAEFKRGLDPDWRPPRSISSWGGGRPLDRIRFAGSNRLMVEIDYRAEEGRRGWRRVEPYAFRRTSEGHVVLFVVNDRGQLRSYRTDRIRDVRITDQTFIPRHVLD
jgi:predicted nucleotidyltransferase component of viral defense system